MKLYSTLALILVLLAIVYLPSSPVNSFSLNSNISNGNPEISWSPVSGANRYEVLRLPVPGTGYTEDSLSTTGTSFIDSEVDVVSIGSGFCQIRYIVEAYNNSTLIDTSDPADFQSDCL